MSSRISLLAPKTDHDAVIGAVFTPLQWGRYFTRKFGLAQKWLQGKSLFDPTMGEGHLLEAVIAEALDSGADIRQLPLHNLFGCELNRRFYNEAHRRIKQTYGIELPRDNFYCQDIFALPQDKGQDKIFDIILANPPWGNFTDLPDFYKPAIKREFLRYGLVANKRDLLWGGSRIDIAALVIQKTIAVHLQNGGEGYYFTPLSLLLNDGAHTAFRRYCALGEDFCIEALYDFGDEKIFNNIATRYGFMSIRKNKRQVFPIPCERREKGDWVRYYAHVVGAKDSALLFSKEADKAPEISSIRVAKANRPRQGVNSCGANDLYFFDDLVENNDGSATVSNKLREACLPRRYLYPVMVAKNFTPGDDIIRRWVFLPYDSNGQVLSAETISGDRFLRSYLHEHQERLRSRKGVMIGSLIQRGFWWGLLGVGAYSFASYKVAWEAYGRDYFAPRIFHGNWQANQSLQAFMPFPTIKEAKRVLGELNCNWVEQYLLAHAMNKTINWAQPGKIMKLLNFA